MQETQEMKVLSLGQEDPLEEEMATHSRILAWKIPWTEEPGGLQSLGGEESDKSTCTHTSCFRGRSCFLWLQVLYSLKYFASHQFKLLLLQSLLIIIYNKWFFLNYFAVSAF